MGYTLHQFRGYVEAAQRRERAMLRGQVLSAMAGMAGGKGAQRLLAALED
jgi:hypothetical protein